MLRIHPTKRRRPGAVTPLTAFLIVAIMALMALSIDLGYIAVVRTEMQNAADAAALAGTSQLLHPSLLRGAPDQATATGNARTEAQLFASRNTGGNVALTLDANTSNTPTGDIVCGYLANPTDRTDPMTFTQFPNSVQVRVHRDNIRNGSLSLFFARALGIPTQDLQATATATYQGELRGFRINTPGVTTCKLLPYTLQVCVWDNAPGRPWYDASKPPGVLQGNGTDNFTRSSAGAVSGSTSAPAPDLIKECKLFPLSNGNGGGGGLQPGNFGCVDIGGSNNSTSDLARQILYGPNAADLAYFPGGVCGLDPVTNTLTLNGDTGISAGVKDELAAIKGQPRIIPLFTTVSGNGNNAMYTIVAFAGVTVVDVKLTGSLSSKHITIQPCFVIDANAVGGGTSTSSYFATKPLGLSR
jgi:Flp pilus assembly protein TadG